MAPLALLARARPRRGTRVPFATSETTTLVAAKLFGLKIAKDGNSRAPRNYVVSHKIVNPLGFSRLRFYEILIRTSRSTRAANDFAKPRFAAL